MRREWEQIKCSTHLFRSNDVKWNTQWPLTKGKYSNWIELVLCCCQCLYISKAHLVVGFLSVDDCVCVCVCFQSLVFRCVAVCALCRFFFIKTKIGELHTKCWSNVAALKLGSIIVMMKSNVENVQTEMERETRLDRQTQMQNIVKLWVNKRRRWCMCVYSRRWNEKSIEKKSTTKWQRNRTITPFSNDIYTHPFSFVAYRQIVEMSFRSAHILNAGDAVAIPCVSMYRYAFRIVLSYFVCVCSNMVKGQ